MGLPNLPEGCQYFPASALKPEVRADDKGLVLVVGTKVALSTRPDLSIVGGSLAPVSLHSPLTRIAYTIKKSNEAEEAFLALETGGVQRFHRAYDGIKDTGHQLDMSSAEGDINRILKIFDEHFVSPEYLNDNL